MVAERENTVSILLNGVPRDVVDELERRAARNFRQRTGEILAILTAVCRSGATLPGLGIGDQVPVPSTEG